MNIKEAAEYLGISVKTLERKIAGGEIAVAYTPGATGKQRVFDAAELDRFRDSQAAWLATTTYVARPRVAPVASDAASPEQALQTAFQSQDIAPIGERLISALEGLRTLTSANGQAPTISDLAHKLTLSLAEAAQLSGLSRGHIREAIGKGKLKARIIGRGWRVKRDDLDGYVKKL